MLTPEQERQVRVLETIHTLTHRLVRAGRLGQQDTVEKLLQNLRVAITNASQDSSCS